MARRSMDNLGARRLFVLRLRRFEPMFMSPCNRLPIAEEEEEEEEVFLTVSSSSGSSSLRGCGATSADGALAAGALAASLGRTSSSKELKGFWETEKLVVSPKLVAVREGEIVLG